MRKLATAAISFSAAVFAANYILPLSVLPYVAAVLVLAGIGLMLFKRRWLLLFELIFLFFGFGLAVFAVNAGIKSAPVAALDGRTLMIECRVLDYPTVYDDYARIDVRLVGDGLPKLRAILYDNSLEMTELTPGNIVQLEAKLRPADTRFGKEYDYYNSKNVFLIASSKSPPVLLYDGFHVSALSAIVRNVIAACIDRIFPADTVGFMRSLLLGDKSVLYDDVALYTDLSRAGFMHVAAVSGMHISFLVGILQLFLGCSVKSSWLCIALVWAFAIFTGSTPSAVRAAFMQSVLLAAPIARREDDTLTSLSFILALVLAVNPYAAASVWLQLSFGAMAGILCFNEPLSELIKSFVPGKRAKRIMHYPIGILSVSLSVMPFTILLSAIHFGEVSILSPLSNMAALWAVSLCFFGGVVCCLIAPVLTPLAVIGAKLVAVFVRYVFLVAGIFSSIPFAVVYISGAILIIWIVISYIVFAVIGISRAKPPFKLILPIVISISMLAAARGLTLYSYRSSEGCISVVDVGQGQSIVAISGNDCVIVDCGGGGKLENAGEITSAYLLSRGISKADCLMLTHLHSDHANGVLHLMECIDIAEILLPANPQDEDGILVSIVESAARHGTNIRFINEDTEEYHGKIRLEMFAPNDNVDANEECLACRLYVNDFDLLITADGSAAAERELMRKHDLSGVDVLVVGHHGSRYSSGREFIDALDSGTAVISSGYNNYGHPTFETLERLDAYGYNIYRTDLNGTVEFRIGKNNG